MPFLSSAGAQGAAPDARSPSLSAVPPAPRKPSTRARRLVFAYQGTQYAMLLIGLIFLGMGLLFSLIFCWGLPVDLTLATTGRPHTGVVVSARLNTNVTINDEHPTEVRYTYALDGAELQGSTSLLGEEYEDLAPGTPIDLEVSTVRPQWSRVRGGTYSTFGYFGSFTLLFPIVGAAMTFFAVRSNRREIRAFREGRPVLATVVFAGPDTSTRVNGRHPFLVRWEFRGPEGAVHEGSISSMRQLELEEFARSPEVVVLYDPENPAINTLYVS